MAKESRHHYIKFSWFSDSQSLLAAAARLAELKQLTAKRKNKRDFHAAFNVILTAAEVLEAYSGSELYIPIDNNLYNARTQRNAAYTTEVRDALKYLIAEGYLVQTEMRQTRLNKDTGKLYWLPFRYRLSERWRKEISPAPMSPPGEVRRNPLLGFVELRKRRIINHKLVNRPVSISAGQQRKYGELLRETEAVLKRHMEIMAGTQVTLGSKPIPSSQFYYTRIFNNGRFSDGGRFYCQAQYWLKKDARPYLYFNGETTVEIDITAIHPHLCYLKCGSVFSGEDPYQIVGFDRDQVKTAFNIMLNRKGTKDNKSSANTIADILRVEVSLAQALEQAILDTHAPIAAMFNSGAGLALQRIDSDIACKVLRGLVGQGRPVFAIHDSFVVSARDTEDLSLWIRDSYERVTKHYSSDYTSYFKGGKVVHRDNISADLNDAIDRSLFEDTSDMDGSYWERVLAQEIIEEPPELMSAGASEDIDNEDPDCNE